MTSKPPTVPQPTGTQGSPPPRVSVVIPCYKQASFLAEAVDSLVAQTFEDWECIVVDDGSPDDTAAVAEALIAKHGQRRIRLVRQANMGLSQARNTGVCAARGRYILPLDSDDRLAPTMLARAIAVLDANPGVSIAYTHAQCFGTSTGIWRCGPLTIDRLRVANQIPYCSLYRRGVWDAVGGYNTNLDAYEDWDFWIGAVERGFRGECIGDEALFFYRTKPQSMLTEAEARKPQLVARIALNHPGLFPAEQEAAARKVLRCAMPERRAAWAPAVSVVAVTQAGGGALAKTLASVLGQTMQDFEVVLVNYGESGAEELVSELDRGDRIHYVRLARSTGRAAARNAGVRMARGRWIAYADEGDVFYPEHLATLVGALRETGAPFAYGDAHCAPLARGDGRSAHRRETTMSAHAAGDVYFASTRIPAICLLHERQVFQAVGGFDETLALFEEWDFQIRLLVALRAIHVDKVVGETADSAEIRAKERADGCELARASQAAIERKHAAAFGAARTARQAKHGESLSAAQSLLKSGNVREAAAILEAYVRTVPYCADAHNDLAVLYHSLGDRARSLASMVRALELEPHSAAFRQNAQTIEKAIAQERAARTAVA